MSGYNLPDDVTQDMIDAQYEPDEADLASMQPAEPGYGSAVRDQHGGVWAYSEIGWWMAGAHGPIPWVVLASRGPLRLLVDGPVLT